MTNKRKNKNNKVKQTMCDKLFIEYPFDDSKRFIGCNAMLPSECPHKNECISPVCWDVKQQIKVTYPTPKRRQ